MLGNHGRSITRRVFTPFARLLAKAGITPDQVTITGTLLSVGIAVSTLPFGYVWQGALALALVLFADSVDGTLARMTAAERDSEPSWTRLSTASQMVLFSLRSQPGWFSLFPKDSHALLRSDSGLQRLLARGRFPTPGRAPSPLGSK